MPPSPPSKMDRSETEISAIAALTLALRRLSVRRHLASSQPLIPDRGLNLSARAKEGHRRVSVSAWSPAFEAMPAASP